MTMSTHYRIPCQPVALALGARWAREQGLNPEFASNYNPIHDWTHWYFACTQAMEGIVMALDEVLELNVAPTLDQFELRCIELAWPGDVWTTMDVERVYTRLMELR